MLLWRDLSSTRGLTRRRAGPPPKRGPRRRPSTERHGEAVTAIMSRRTRDEDTMPTPLSTTEIASRRPVWSALSELFLDTSLDSQDLDRIAGELADSQYAISELEEILLWEVFPACRSNLVSLAGEWAGFDLDWLQARILNGPSPIGRVWAATVGRLGRMCSISWWRIRRRVESIREGNRRLTSACSRRRRRDRTRRG